MDAYGEQRELDDLGNGDLSVAIKLDEMLHHGVGENRVGEHGDETYLEAEKNTATNINELHFSFSWNWSWNLSKESRHELNIRKREIS